MKNKIFSTTVKNQKIIENQLIYKHQLLYTFVPSKFTVYTLKLNKIDKNILAEVC